MQRCWLVFSLVIICCGSCPLYAQGFGAAPSYGGSDHGGSSSFRGSWSADQATLSSDAALRYITVDGTANIRVAPEEIRVVLAIAVEGKTGDECQARNKEKADAVLAAWSKLKVPKEKIVADFISLLPRYEWQLEEREGERVRVQKKAGYRMQSNLHIAVKTEAEAMQAINAAFEQGVTDIVTFDYWSSQIDAKKVEARRAALKAAKEKAELLLEVFPKPPAVVNVAEKTAALFPHSLYLTYENVLEEEIIYRDNRETRIKAYRPKMTYFHGLQSQSDVQPESLPMKPEIVVVSTVRIYYESPGRQAEDNGPPRRRHDPAP